MKVSFSPFSASSTEFPAIQLPSPKQYLLKVGIVLASLLLCLSVWLYTQGYWPTVGNPLRTLVPVETVEPLSLTASYDSAMELRQSGDLIGAIHQLEQVERMTPQSVPVLYELGRAKFQMGQVQAAIAAYRAALAVDPDHAPSAYELGSLLVTLGQLDEGIQQLQHSVMLSPTALSFYDLGIALGRAGDSQAKVNMLKEAIALQPEYADAHLNLGLTYARLHDLAAAKRALQQARDLYQMEIEKLEHAHLGRNSLDAQVIDQMLLSLDAGCGVECWAGK